MREKGGIRIGILFVFILFIGIMGYLIVKESLHLRDLSAEVHLAEQRVSQQHRLIQQLRELDKHVTDMQEQNEIINRMIPAQPMEEEVLTHIQKNAEVAMVPLQTIRFGKRSEGMPSKMPIHMEFRGTYPDFLNLLASLMYGDRLICIDKIEMVRSAASIGIQIDANAFYRALESYVEQ